MKRKFFTIKSQENLVACYEISKISMLYRSGENSFDMIIDGVQIPMQWEVKEDCDRTFNEIYNAMIDNKE